MKKLHPLISYFYSCIIFSAGIIGCSSIQGLRNEIEDPSQEKFVGAEFDYRSPANRDVPPPPATVGDGRLSSISGTPVDYSGLRAKSGRITKEDFWADAYKNENSLWIEDGQNNFYFSKNRIKSAGDIVTVKIEDGLRNDMINQVKKMLPDDYQNSELRIPGLTKLKDAAKDVGADAAGKALSAVEKAAAPSDEASPDDLFTAEVIERYPNGNLRIRGIKHLPFKKTSRNIEVTSIIKSADLDENDIISSSKFLESKTEMYR